MFTQATEHFHAGQDSVVLVRVSLQTLIGLEAFLSRLDRSQDVLGILVEWYPSQGVRSRRFATGSVHSCILLD
jgi:hypothetical protein